MKWLVSGGRKFADIRFVYDKLDGLAGEHGLPVLLIHGSAVGVDTIADRWAQVNNVDRLPVPADWPKYGRGAGPMRNTMMLDYEPDLAIFFPGGTGTIDMYRKAQRASIPCVVFGRDTFI